MSIHSNSSDGWNTALILAVFATVTFIGAAAISCAAAAEEWKPNYDEEKVPKYTLPDLLILANGERVTDAAAWRDKRRPEILELFRTHVYGRSPGRPDGMHWEVTSVDASALDGRATRKEVTVYFTADKGGPQMHVLLFLPNHVEGRVPAFLGLALWDEEAARRDLEAARKTAAGDAKDSGAEEGLFEACPCPARVVIEHGYAMATLNKDDIDPDFDDGFQNGIHPLFYKDGQTRPAPDEWGTIGAWAWGLSRTMDYLEADDRIDPRRVAVLGHSRMGKTALWAGAQDERFALVISNDSGCAGAALSRRCYGETVGRINRSFPHWFCDNFSQYNENEAALPVDQHMLIALMAPRLVYIASAEKDGWADPRGEFLSAAHAAPVYCLLGVPGLGVTEMPELNHPVGDAIGYHYRTGKHDLATYDLRQYLAFAEKHWRK